MSVAKILVIEDVKNILELVKYNLEEAGFAVIAARRGDEGLDKAVKEKPDLIVLDIMLPGLDGLEVCKLLRQNKKTSSIPILMLTAKAQETDKVLGLELGADDYMTKPFSPRELVARLKALLRRSRPMRESVLMLKAGPIEMNVDKHMVTLKGKPLELTHKEYHLLKTFLESGGRLLTRDHLLDRVWGYAQAGQIETRTIDMHVGQLRKKLKSESERIITVKNEGYRFQTDED